MPSFKKLVISFLPPFLAGFLGSVFTFPAIPGWYEGLNKPSFSPPNFIFGPVWTLLYFLMGVSFYLVLSSKNKDKKESYFVFALQVVFNTLWSFAFFGLRSPLLGALVIIILWFLIVLMIIKFYRLNKLAGLLNLPYLAWVSFATILNLSVYALN
ncbi:MAG: sensory protein TspO [Patescibacteria group bacterium]|nr:MAG: sensory protein TspO [Patescibacteria group bacterium]